MIAGSRIGEDGIMSTTETGFEDDFLMVSADHGGYVRRLFVKWLDEVSFLVPIGYQDEGGFHFGPEPLLKRADRILNAQWPFERAVESCASVTCKV
jgi:hypothetical protein